MLKSFKYRLYPTDSQKELIAKHIGSCRFVYNLALETKTTAYSGNKVNLSGFNLIKQLTDLKDECPWLREVSGESLQQSVLHLDTAYTLFFKGCANFPKFKKKNNSYSFVNVQHIYIENNRLRICKFQEGIKIRIDRPIKGKIKQCAVSKTPTGKYYASILCDTGEPIPSKPPIKEENTIGIDLGIKSFLVTSDGEVVDNPKYLKNAQSRLSYIQRQYSKYKGKRTRHRLASLHEKVANQRKDFLQKLSTKLIRENQTICLEDLNIKGMVKNHNLAGSISDAGWGMFIEMLEYKAGWYGNNILKIGRFEPSSKTCSCCGNVNQELTLKDRSWTCSECGSILDRDENAALNIKNFALKTYLCTEHTLKNQGELPAVARVLIPEIQLIIKE